MQYETETCYTFSVKIVIVKKKKGKKALVGLCHEHFTHELSEISDGLIPSLRSWLLFYLYKPRNKCSVSSFELGMDSKSLWLCPISVS